MWEQGLPAMEAMWSLRNRGACLASKLCFHNSLATMFQLEGIFS